MVPTPAGRAHREGARGCTASLTSYSTRHLHTPDTTTTTLPTTHLKAYIQHTTGGMPWLTQSKVPV